MPFVRDRTQDCLMNVRVTQLTEVSKLTIEEYFETKMDGGSARTIRTFVVAAGSGAVFQEITSLKVG